ncbi:citrate synthase [Paraburkholderia hospita]|uniref:citrate synthase n=1 Tax=Paraburkholderia hospita TaxID=169430 RepID=UPI0009A77BF5|nr:citrate synthase [Paraburkholderia hospita]SKD06419.1 Citrate synthase [Paraburkholderia hospita]
MEPFLSASDVMQLLGIKKQTLYAYVSRGILRRASVPGSRKSMYAREDVEKMLARKTPTGELRPTATVDAAQPLINGSFLIPSAITEITPEGPRYRGINARDLAAHPGHLENVAELLWTGVLIDEPVIWTDEPAPTNVEPAIAALQRGEGHIPILRVMAAASLALGESAAEELRSGNTARLARRIISAYAGCLGLLVDGGQFVRRCEGESLASLALRALGKEQSVRATAALNTLFICCADHELSPATYAARVVASTGAGLQACLIAAIGAHSGHLLGGACDRLDSLFFGDQGLGNLREALLLGRNTQRKLPGFGHQLYPQGDPRAGWLFDLTNELAPNDAVSDVRSFAEEVYTETGLKPSLELGLVVVARALGLPHRSASALWAIGRSVGWVAHIMEQRLSGTLIRPRARRSG